MGSNDNDYDDGAAIGESYDDDFLDWYNANYDKLQGEFMASDDFADAMLSWAEKQYVR